MLPMVAEDYKKDETIKEPVGPKEWINLIRKSAFVLTDSFHCTLFSIRYHKDFYTLQRFSEKDKRGQNTRIINLFDLTGMNDRLLLPEINKTDYSLIPHDRFNYSDEQLSEKIKCSKKWLCDCLKKCQDDLEDKYD